MDKFSLQDLCYKNIKCVDWQCQKKHPRCYAGICIEGRTIDEKKGKCNNSDCQLIHLKKKPLQFETQISQINGVYRINICQNISNCNNNQCRYLHPIWAKDYCYQYYNDNECQQQDECKIHKKWNDIREEVYKKFNILQLNPEKLCQKYNCNCEFHLANIKDNICIDYFKGVCPSIDCSKKHIFWEELKINRQLQFEQPKLQSCKQINNKIQNDQIQNKSQSQIMLDEQEIKRMNKAIQQSNIIDIIFILDCTKTMDPWIQQCHSQIANIIEKFSQQSQSYMTRIGFVGYRDIIIKKQIINLNLDRRSQIQELQNQASNQIDKVILEKNHVVFHDLTNNIESIKEFIKQQKADGGGDEAEDVIAGIEKASQLNISKHQDSVLITFLFADSPCHGKQYHDIEDDDFMDDIPENTLENLMNRYRSIKKNNFFFCSRITKKTEKMFNIMQSAFPEISITDIQNPEDFPNLVGLQLSKSILKISKSKLFKPQEIRAEYFKSKYINYNCKTKEDKNKFWNQFTKMNQAEQRSGTTTIKINRDPVKILDNEDGVNSYIFQLFDVINNQNLVAKIPKKIVNEYNQKKEQLIQQNSNEPVKLSEQTIQEANLFAESRFQSQTIAKQLAQIYREKVKDINGAPPIFYVSPMQYKLSTPFYGLSLIYAETYINLPHIQWIKYSNNTNYQQQDYYYYSSFSHFTYEETDKQLLVADLQGKNNILSDPSIQTLKQFSNCLNQDTTNFNQEGISLFLFDAHKKCSFICQELQLSNRNETNDIDKTSWQLNKSQELSIICETCDEYQQIKIEDYEKNIHKKCYQCHELEKSTYEVQCSCCFQKFELLYNQGIRIGTNVAKCDNCKISCKQLNLPCVYCKVTCKLKVSEEKIDNRVFGICKEGRKYLSALKCIICNAQYQFDVELQDNQYDQGNYKCKKCV